MAGYSTRLDNIMRNIKDLGRRLSALERINQQSILSFGNITLDGVTGLITAGPNAEVTIDGVNGRIVVKDDSLINSIALVGDDGSLRISDTGEDVLTEAVGDLAFYFNRATGQITIKGDVLNTNAEAFSHVTSEHWFTGVSTYEKISGTSFLLNGDNFGNQSIFFECNMLVEQSGRVAYARLYNLTDSAIVAGSEIGSVHVGTFDGGRGIYTDWEVLRSGALTLVSGQKEYVVQVRQQPAGNGGDKAHFFQGRMVVIQQ